MTDDPTPDTLPGMPAEATPPAEPATTPKKATRSRETAPRTKARKAGRPSNDEKLRETINEQLTMLGLALSSAGMVSGRPALGADGVAVTEHADAIADALVNVAKQNATVRKLLETGVESSAWFGLAIAVTSLGRDIAQNHGVIPGGVITSASEAEPAWSPILPQE